MNTWYETRLRFLTLLALLAASLGGSLASADCIYYSDYMHWQGHTDMFGLWCDYHSIGVSDDYACVLVWEFGYDMQYHYYIQVVDVSNPGDPQLRGRRETMGRSEDIVVSGNYVYAACYYYLMVFDLSDPDNLQLVGTETLPDDGNGVDLAGNIAYVAYGDYYSGLRVIDVSNPNVPVTLATVAIPETAHDVAVSGSIAVVLAGDTMFYVIDISDPSDPQIQGSLNSLGGTYGVAISGTHAYVAAAAAGLQVIDIGDPTDPQLIAALPLPGLALNVKAGNNHVYVADDTGGLQIVDISDPAQPIAESHAETYGAVWAIGLSGETVFITDEYEFYAYDVSHSGLPPLGNSEASPGVTYGLAAAGQYLFAANYNYGLQVYDASDPGDPQYVAGLTLPDQGWDLAIAGAHAYVATNNAGLQVVDISDPLDPQIAGSLPGNWIRYVDVEGTIACALNGDLDEGFMVIDISDPANPQLLGAVDLDGVIHGVQIEGSIAYASADRFYVIDITDPAEPRILGSLDAYCTKFAVAGSYAYATGSNLKVIDVSDPANLQIVGTANLPPSLCNGVEVVGSTVYLVDGGFGLFTYDVSDPHAPRLLGGADMDIPISLYALLVRDDDVYVGGSGGIHVAPLQCAPTAVPDLNGYAAATRLTSYPNPSRGPTSFRFESFRRGRVEAKIYSPDGRLVRRLLAASLDPGRHELVWDGRDDEGLRVPAGVYLSRISTPEGTRTSRCVILR